MKDPIRPDQCAAKLRALGAPERLRIVRVLGRGRMNVGEIAAAARVPLNNVAHHLAILRKAGFVRGEKHGRFVFYSLRPGFVEANHSSDANEHFNLGCCRLEVPPNPGG
jgi:ArsR family transcriptional regulator